MLECRDISKVYQKGNWFSSKGETQALCGASLDMKAGKSMGIVGENGSGKSTLTRIILGLEEPTSGTVLFEGENIHQMVREGRRAFRRYIQTVFQDPLSAVNPRWNAFRVITEPLVNYGRHDRQELRVKAGELMRLVELNPAEMDKNVTRFSSGQQQRICIARALALNPKLLILDEAVSSLDALIAAQITALLEHLKNTRRISLLIISHDIRIIFKLCEDIIVMDKGRIIERRALRGEYSPGWEPRFPLPAPPSF